MLELNRMLNTSQAKKVIELTKNEKKIINYLLALRGERLFIERMSKEIDLAKETIYTNLRNLQKRNVVFSSWQLNPYVLGFKIIELEASVKKNKEKGILAQLAKHPAISKIARTFQNNLRVDIVVQHIEDYKEIEKHLKRIGIEPISTKTIVEKLYDS